MPRVRYPVDHPSTNRTVKGCSKSLTEALKIGSSAVLKLCHSEALPKKGG